ncbi:sensor histidine kinase [Deinococcus pimensis]|uniref:sensor histidine kinase n=1 Tax=Deinococcus pimensis TaxID=309888 RepID=UPI0004B0822E|nr:HAMP domain-containing sensor histidine kinase [Deinococcus pimensis]
MTLRWRLTIFYTTLLTALLMVIAVAVVSVLSTSLRRNVENELLADLQQIRTSPVLDSLELASLGSNTITLGVDPYNLFGYIELYSGIPPADLQKYDRAYLGAYPLKRDYPTSNIVADPRNPPDASPFKLSDEEFRRLQRTSQVVIERKLLPSDGKEIPTMVLVSVLPYDAGSYVDNRVVQSSLVLYLARDLSGVYGTVRDLQLIMLLVSLFGVIGAGVGAYFLAGRALLPLRLVRKAAESISEKTLRQRVPEPATGDEVQALAHALNGMLDRIERSFEAQRRFTSDASHELRTPVTAIGGHAGYLLRRTQPSPQQAESLNIIKNEADRLSGLIASLLELARSDSGVNQLRQARMLARLFLEDIARELRPLAQAQGATVTVEGDEVEFAGDPDKLRQVVINLVSNALKAGSHAVTLGSTREDGHLLLRVRDDGPGIPEEHLGRLFDRFYRVEESRSRDVGGSGLGLAIAKAIVDAHDGRIWVESEVGVGTTVFVRLPVGTLAPEPDEEEAEIA